MGHCDLEEPRLQAGVNMTNAVAARKFQKSDREKLRREKIKKHFQQLGHMIDSDRHKNDKATIVSNAIQTLKELTSEVSWLQAEHAALYQGYNELTLENKELREENASLQSDIKTLGVYYNQTPSFMFPWALVDPSVVLAPPFSNSAASPVPLGPFPRCSPLLQPIPFFGNQSGASSDSGSMFIPFLTPTTTHIDQASTSNASSILNISSDEVMENGPYGLKRSDYSEEKDDSEDVVTELELKMPGSTS